ncbi:hypothetical protein [Actinokineospora spheciospongiae]|uniref:hypothetical protein n=1 Tax=Actinokineospora spheciospongiae TaxID=909613 RepID=UPI0015E853B2|nr:hypothetical protein [Actinokineospora spheciospongiae]
MPVQDDVREQQLVQLFNLFTPDDRTRSGTDAYLKINNEEIPFELKSTTGKSVSTVRDFGAEHIRKWANLHWIFGFYNKAGSKILYCHYASPADMKAWIEEKQRYVHPDLFLKREAAQNIGYETLFGLLGEKEKYSEDDAKWIMKNQWKRDRYLEAQDSPSGYSAARMVEILRLRCEYVIDRGATLNNPHIPSSYFRDWEKITENHAATLREKVRSYLMRPNAATIDAATL